MKREELRPIELECNMGPDVNGVVQREPWKAYDIDEVDLLLDQYDNKIKTLKESIANGDVSRITWIDECLEKDGEIASLKAQLAEAKELSIELQKRNKNIADNAIGNVEAYKSKRDAEIESLKASHYAEMVDAGMRERRLRRALWLARAELCRRLDIDRYLRNHRNSWYNENCLTWHDACVAMEVKMCKAENKCLKKAEQYR